MENKKLITILVPAYNEQDVLSMLYDRLLNLMNTVTNYDFEILFVNVQCHIPPIEGRSNVIPCILET